MILRTVVLSILAQEVLDRESDLRERLRDVYEGLEWRLSRDPASGYQYNEKYWLMKLDGNLAAEIPGIVVLYIFDNEHVDVLRMLIQVRE